MAYDPTSDFQGLGAALNAPQYGQTNPNLNPSLQHTMRAIALQNALGAQKSYDIGLRGREQDLENQMKMDELKNQQAGPLDWVGSIFGGGNALNSILNRKNNTNNGLFDKMGF